MAFKFREELEKLENRGSSPSEEERRRSLALVEIETIEAEGKSQTDPSIHPSIHINVQETNEIEIMNTQRHLLSLQEREIRPSLNEAF